MDTGNKRIEDESPIQTHADANATPETKAGSTEGTISGDKTMAMLCHLLSFVGFLGIPLGNILGPLVLWLIKKDEDPLVNATGKEVLNFQISVSIYAIVCILLAVVVIGFILLPILLIAVVIYTIIGAIRANEGQLYRYPLTLRLIK